MYRCAKIRTNIEIGLSNDTVYKPGPHVTQDLQLKVPFLLRNIHAVKSKVPTSYINSKTVGIWHCTHLKKEAFSVLYSTLSNKQADLISEQGGIFSQKS